MRILGLLGEEPSKVDLSKVVPRVDETSYRQNLEEIAKETQKDDIPLVFILLKDNPLQTELLDQGIERLSSHDYVAAISALKSVVDSENMFSDLARLYLAKAYEATGHPEIASNILTSQSQLSLTGGRPVRLDKDYNRIMREVANKYGVLVIDAGKVLDERPTDYVDFCHFNAAGHRKVGRLLAEQISQILVGHQSS